MYKIIGGDQKEYGPVTGEQLRQWFTEGRINGQTSILPDGASQWTPFSALPEFADLFGPIAPAVATLPYARPADASEEAILGRDYALDIGGCISRSWTLVKDNFWPMVGISTMVVFIIGGINQVLSLVTAPVTTDMMQNHHFSPFGILVVLGVSMLSGPIDAVFSGGLFKYYLKLIRHEPASIGDAFSGFNSFGPLLLLGLVRTLLVWVGLAFCVIPGIYLSVAWIFSVPLIIDRGMNFWDAMEFSRKVVSRHWFIVFAFLLVAGLVMMCGVLACCVGIFVTMTIGWVAMMYAYEDIFGRRAA